jgi:hypothetical protein
VIHVHDASCRCLQSIRSLGIAAPSSKGCPPSCTEQYQRLLDCLLEVMLLNGAFHVFTTFCVSLVCLRLRAQAQSLLKMMQLIGALSGGRTVTQVALNWLMAKGAPSPPHPPVDHLKAAAWLQDALLNTVSRACSSDSAAGKHPGHRSGRRPAATVAWPHCIAFCTDKGTASAPGEVRSWILLNMQSAGWLTLDVWIRCRRHPYPRRKECGAGKGAGRGAGLVAGRQRGGHDRGEAYGAEIVVLTPAKIALIQDCFDALSSGIKLNSRYAAHLAHSERHTMQR